MKPSPDRNRFARSIRSHYVDAAFGPAWRAFWLKTVIACGLLSGLLLSPKLWHSAWDWRTDRPAPPGSLRTYPTCPVSDLLPNIQSPLDRWWFATLLVLLAGIALTPRSRWLVLAFILLAGLLSLWDQSRWQPWFYQYLFMVAAFVFTTDTRNCLNVCRFIMAATYVWSGLQKCNVSFVTDIYPWMAGAFAEPLQTLLMPAGVLAPILETTMGLGVLVPRLRQGSVILLLAMHTFLLFCLGPLGLNINNVVWPWNLAMMAAAVILFWRTPDVSCREIVWPGSSAFHWLVLLLFGFMPALNFLGLWDSYLSAGLYSGNEIRAEVEFSETVRERLPSELKRRLHLTSKNDEEWYVVDLRDWPWEMNVPPNPAPRIYRHAARSFCPLADKPGDVVLVIHGRPDWWSGVRQEAREDLSEDGNKE